MVTILLATYNGCPYIKDLLESLRSQTYKDWRLVVSDDGSTDETVRLVADFAVTLPGKVRLLSKPEPCGSSKGNFMYLLSHTESDYYMFCDQDDVWLPDKIEATLQLMKKLERGQKVPALVHTDLKVVDKNLKTIAESFMKYQHLADVRQVSRLLIQNCVTGCTAMINNELKKLAVRGTDTSRMVMHDHWLAICAAVYGRIGFLNRPTILYRQHGNNTLGAQGALDMLRLYGRLREGKKRYRDSVDQQMVQAGYFDEVMEEWGLPAKDKALITGFANLRDASKLERVSFYCKHKVNKTGLVRRLMQHLWG